jgi:type II secretory pathway pseudopilin PulG
MIKKAAVLSVLIMVALLSVAGCTNPQNSTQTITHSDKVVANITVNSVATSYRLQSGDYYATPSSGNKFLILNVTATNLNEQGLSLGYRSFFKLTTSDGGIYSTTSYTALLPNELAGVSNTNPGEKLTGQILFEVPQSAKATMLTYGDGFYAAVTKNVTTNN